MPDQIDAYALKTLTIDPRFKALPLDKQRAAFTQAHAALGLKDPLEQSMQDKGLGPTLWEHLGSFAQGFGNEAVQTGSLGIIDRPEATNPAEQAGAMLGGFVGGFAPVAVGTALGGPIGGAAALAAVSGGTDIRAQLDAGRKPEDINWGRTAIATGGGLVSGVLPLGRVGQILSRGGLLRRMAQHAAAQGLAAGATSAGAQATEGNIDPGQVLQSATMGAGFGAAMGLHAPSPVERAPSRIAERLVPLLRQGESIGPVPPPEATVQAHIVPKVDPQSFAHDILQDPVLIAQHDQTIKMRQETQAATDAYNKAVSANQAKVEVAKQVLAEQVKAGHLTPEEAGQHMADIDRAAATAKTLAMRNTQAVHAQILEKFQQAPAKPDPAAPPAPEAVQSALSAPETPPAVRDDSALAPAQNPHAPVEIVTPRPVEISESVGNRVKADNTRDVVSALVEANQEAPAQDAMEGLGFDVTDSKNRKVPAGYKTLHLGSKKINFNPKWTLGQLEESLKAEGVQLRDIAARVLAKSDGDPVATFRNELQEAAQARHVTGEPLESVQASLKAIAERSNAHAQALEAYDVQSRRHAREAAAAELVHNLRAARTEGQATSAIREHEARIQGLPKEDRAWIAAKVEPHIEAVADHFNPVYEGQELAPSDTIPSQAAAPATPEAKAPPGALSADLTASEKIQAGLGRFASFEDFQTVAEARKALPTKMALKAEFKARTAGLKTGTEREAATGFKTQDAYASQFDPQKAQMDEVLAEVHPNVKDLQGIVFDAETGIGQQHPVQPEQLRIQDIYNDLPTQAQRDMARVYDAAIKKDVQVQETYAAERTGETSTHEKKLSSPTHFYKAKNGDIFVEVVNSDGYPAKRLIKSGTDAGADSGHLALPVETKISALRGTAANVELGPREFDINTILDRAPRAEALKHSEVSGLLDNFKALLKSEGVPRELRAELNTLIETKGAKIDKIRALDDLLAKHPKALKAACLLFGLE
jgi:hypothetical protein